ncbi:MAG TPA: iron-containing redox enzyme family protein [Nitriliruptorales bacterium]|nr:iron-containing redox enzyme family protein [Nitriliruptorales bacterium]
MESERLRRKLEFLLPVVRAAGRRFLGHPRVADLYPEYLFTSHCIVRASVPLMEAAVRQATAGSDRDPVADGVARYLEEHIPEERDHDEWLLEDLETLGIDRAAILSRPPSATVAALIGAQYYWVLHYHPVALLGYMALLEGYPPRRDEIEVLAARTGYDRAAFRTLMAHAELDPHHRDDLDRTLDALPLSPAQRSLLGTSALHSARLFARCVEEIVEPEIAWPDGSRPLQTIVGHPRP